MPRESSSVPSKRALRPRQEVDYTRKVESNGGTNTPSWVKAGTTRGKETLRHRAARQSLSKRGKPLSAAGEGTRKQRGISGGQNQPPSPPADSSSSGQAARESASSQPVSTSKAPQHPVHALSKPSTARDAKASQQADRKSKSSKRQTVGPQPDTTKRQKKVPADEPPAAILTGATDEAHGVHVQPTQGKAGRRGKLQKLSQRNEDPGIGIPTCV